MNKFTVTILAVTFLFISTVALAAPAREATLANVIGEVMVRADGTSAWKPAEPGAKININDEIKTSAGGSIDVLLDNGDTANVNVKEKSQFKIKAMDLNPATGEKSTYLDLALGKVLIHAQKLEGNSKFEVITPTSTTGVRGTVFEVSVD